MKTTQPLQSLSTHAPHAHVHELPGLRESRVCIFWVPGLHASHAPEKPSLHASHAPEKCTHATHTSQATHAPTPAVSPTLTSELRHVEAWMTALGTLVTDVLKPRVAIGQAWIDVPSAALSGTHVLLKL